MGLAWLFVVALIALIVFAVSRSRPDVKGTGNLAQPLGNSDVTVPPATEFGMVLGAIDALEQIKSPSLECLRELSRLLDRFYPSIGTSVQFRRIEATLPQALMGKCVSWELELRDVRDSSLFFSRETVAAAGGFWIELIESRPFLMVECQTVSKDVLIFHKGQIVKMSGRISRVKISWPFLLLMVTAAAVSHSYEHEIDKRGT